MKAIFERLCTVHDTVTRVAADLAAIGLILIVVFYVYEVVTRYFFDSPTAWVSDFVSYGLCASVFLALPTVTKAKGHVAVTILVDQVPEKIADTIHVIISIIGFACLMFAAYVSAQENLRQYTKNIETLATVAIPQWWVSGFITLGLALSALYMLRYVAPSHRTSDNAFTEEID